MINNVREVKDVVTKDLLEERGNDLKAVKVGYVFNVFTEHELRNVKISKTNRKVVYDGKEYDLYKPSTFNDSTIVDMLLDIKGDLRLNEYEIKK